LPKMRTATGRWEKSPKPVSAGWPRTAAAGLLSRTRWSIRP
jgi:hypothetical protein